MTTTMSRLLFLFFLLALCNCEDVASTSTQTTEAPPAPVKSELVAEKKTLLSSKAPGEPDAPAYSLDPASLGYGSAFVFFFVSLCLIADVPTGSPTILVATRLLTDAAFFLDGHYTESSMLLILLVPLAAFFFTIKAPGPAIFAFIGLTSIISTAVSMGHLAIPTGVTPAVTPEDVKAEVVTSLVWVAGKMVLPWVALAVPPLIAPTMQSIQVCSVLTTFAVVVLQHHDQNQMAGGLVFLVLAALVVKNVFAGKRGGKSTREITALPDDDGLHQPIAKTRSTHSMSTRRNPKRTERYRATDATLPARSYVSSSTQVTPKRTKAEPTTSRSAKKESRPPPPAPPARPTPAPKSPTAGPKSPKAVSTPKAKRDASQPPAGSGSASKRARN